MTKTEYVSDPSVYFELVTNPLKKVNNVEVFGEQFLLVNWENLESIVEPHTCSKTEIIQCTTSTGQTCLYFDTDSVIYIHKPE